MVDPTWKTADISSFRGVRSYMDNTEGDIEQALEAVNVEFRVDGETLRTRRGIGVALNITEKASSVFDWVTDNWSFLVWLHPGVGIKIGDKTAADFAASVSTVIAQTTATHATFCQNGNRLYVAFLDSNQRSTSSAYVICRIGSNFTADKLFAPPKTGLTPTITEPGTGRVTQGIHYFGIVLEHRGGFIGRPSPDSGSGEPNSTTFQRITFTSAGDKNLRLVITPSTNWPDDAVQARLVMTPVSNPALYIFVPDAVVTVPAGTTTAITFNIDIDDATLRMSARDDDGAAATKLLSLKTQTTAGTPPFYPHCIFSYGDYIGFVTQLTEPDGNQLSTLLISQRNQAERIILNRSIIRTPNQLPVTLAFELNGQTCIIGPNHTHITSDGGGDPVTWGIPRKIGNGIGTEAHRGVDVDKANNYALVASKTGLYVFNGFAYSNLPISHGQTDKWQTINWSYARNLIVKNDVTEKIVYVLAPTGSTPTYKLWAWSYKNFDPKNLEHWWKSADFSEVTIPNYPFATIAMVQNDLPTAPSTASKQSELWLFPTSTATHFRRMKSVADSNIYQDGPDDSPESIACRYVPRNVPSRMQAALHYYHGVTCKLAGNGQLNVRVQELNNETNNYTDLYPAYLSDQTVDYELFGSDLLAHKAHYVFTNSSAGSYFVLSALRFYYSPAALHK